MRAMRLSRVLVTGTVIGMAGITAGCSGTERTITGAAIGGAVGGVAGGALTGTWLGAGVGAAAGAAVGGLVGNATQPRRRQDY